MNNKEMIEMIFSEKDEILDYIFGKENLRDLNKQETDKLFVYVILELLSKYGYSKYFENPDKFLKDFLRSIGWEKPSVLTYNNFIKEWGTFVNNNLQLLKDVSDYVNDLLYDIDANFLVDFFDTESVLVNKEKSDGSVYLKISSNIYLSRKILEKVKKILKNRGEKITQIDKFLDYLDNDNNVYEFIESFLMELISLLEEDIKYKTDIYISVESITDDNIVVKVDAEDILKYIGARVIFTKEVDDNVIKDLLLFKNEFEDLSDVLYKKLEEWYNNIDEQVNNVYDLLVKIDQEDPDWFFEVITDYISDKYDDYDYDLVDTFIRDKENRKEKLKNFVSMITEIIDENIEEFWISNLTDYFDRNFKVEG